MLSKWLSRAAIALLDDPATCCHCPTPPTLTGSPEGLTKVWRLASCCCADIVKIDLFLPRNPRLLHPATPITTPSQIFVRTLF